MNEIKVKAWLAQAKSERESNLILAVMQDAFKEGRRDRQKEISMAFDVLGVKMFEKAEFN
jgi:hypothetical protein